MKILFPNEFQLHHAYYRFRCAKLADSQISHVNTSKFSLIADLVFFYEKKKDLGKKNIFI